MFVSRDNSGGVVVGALVCGKECSRFLHSDFFSPVVIHITYTAFMCKTTITLCIQTLTLSSLK